MHHKRWLQRGSVEDRQAPHGAGLAFLRALVGTTDTECVTWPFYVRRDGYGSVRYQARPHHAHHVACLFAHGDAPEGKPEAAHACRNRACVNPNQLRWASYVENSADKIAHGTLLKGESSPHAKLNNETAVAVYRDTRSYTAIGRAFGISIGTVHTVKTGKAWSHVTGHTPHNASLMGCAA